MSANHDPLTAIFERLDEWRHFPTYQFERRIDIFFAIYLPEVIEAETECALSSIVIPEFPVLKGLIWKSVDAKLSVKVDYCLFAEDMSRVFFVELKTDRSSRRAEQDHYLATARTIGFRAIVEGVLEIAEASKHHLKYWRLISKLLQLGFLSSRSVLSEEGPKSNREVGTRLRQLEVTDLDPTVEVLYVEQVPDPAPGVRSIGFGRFADVVERYDDRVSSIFAQHLRQWHRAAGSND